MSQRVFLVSELYLCCALAQSHNFLFQYKYGLRIEIHDSLNVSNLSKYLIEKYT